MDYLWLLVGLTILTVGAEILIRNASRLAVNVGISPLVVGLTVVAFGTSMPELVVSLHAGLTGKPEIALGNVMGSNIFNVLFILGVSAVIVPLVVSQQLIRIDVPVMVFVSVLAWAMSLDGGIGRVDGLVLTSGIIFYTIWTVVESRREKKNKDVDAQYEAEYGVKEKSSSWGLLLNVVMLGVGLGLLILGTRFFVEAAVGIAKSWGVSELIIGLTIVAVGTSLPEVAASIVAAIKGERDIAVGNVVGSNIFNILSVLGLTGVCASNIPVSNEVIWFDLPVMVGVAIACMPIFFTGQIVTRWNGVLFLGYYVAYTIFLIMKATKSAQIEQFSFWVLWVAIPLTALALTVGVIRQMISDKAARQIRASSDSPSS
jgi:cation:H+ antiporter